MEGRGPASPGGRSPSSSSGWSPGWRRASGRGRRPP